MLQPSETDRQLHKIKAEVKMEKSEHKDLIHFESIIGKTPSNYEKPMNPVNNEKESLIKL